MIYMGKKTLFTFSKMFENVQLFSHLHLKYAKSAIMTHNIFFLQNINMGKKKQNFMLILNSLMPAFKNGLHKS
jgi:hypothetical protein